MSTESVRANREHRLFMTSRLCWSIGGALHDDGIGCTLQSNLEATMETPYQCKQHAPIWHAILSLLLTVLIFASLGCPGNPDEEIKGDSDILGDINLDLKAPTFGSLKQELAALSVRVSQPSETSGNTLTYSDLVLASWGSGILIWADFPGNGKINHFGPTLNDDAHPTHVYINHSFMG